MSDDQFQELAKRFDKIDERFDEVEKRFDEQDETILKLYQHMQGEFGKLHDEMDHRFAEVHNRLDQVYNLVDKDLKRREADEQERLAMNHQLDRHEHWIGRASKQLGVSYEQ